MIENDTKYISKLTTKDGNVYNLRDTNTYTKDEIDKFFIDSRSSYFKKVNELPTYPEIDIRTVYLVPRTNKFEKDICDEYIFVDGNWEMIGSMDLTNYVPKDEMIPYLIKKDIRSALFNTEETATITTSISIDNDELLLKLGDKFYATKLKYMANSITNKDYTLDNNKRDLPISSRTLDNFIKSKEVNLITEDSNNISFDTTKLRAGNLITTLEYNLSYEMDDEKDISIGKYIKQSNGYYIKLTEDNISNYLHYNTTYTKNSISKILGTVITSLNNNIDLSMLLLQPMVSKVVNAANGNDIYYVLYVRVFCIKDSKELILNNFGSVTVSYI